MNQRKTDEEDFNDLMFKFRHEMGSQIYERFKLMIFRDKIISLKKTKQIGFLCQKVMIPDVEISPILSDLLTNPYIFLNVWLQGLTYKQCNRICDYLGIEIPLETKANGCLLQLFKEEGILKLNRSPTCHQICRIFDAEYPAIDRTQILMVRKKHMASPCQLDQLEKKVKKLVNQVLNMSDSFHNHNEMGLVNVSDLTLGQLTAYRNIIRDDPVCVLTGFPGTGKTYLLRKLVEYFLQFEIDMLFTATSGKAVVNMRKTLEPLHNNFDQMQFGTTCRLFHFNPTKLFKYSPRMSIGHTQSKAPNFRHGKPRVIFVDECSMVNYISFIGIFETAIKYKAKLILIGDYHQLPPIGFGELFRILIDRELCPISTLTEIKRQDNTSLLCQTILHIGQGKFNLDGDIHETCQMIDCDDDNVIVKLLEIIEHNNFTPDNTLVLCGQNNGKLGIKEVNRQLQTFYLRHVKPPLLIKTNDYNFYPKDLVIRLINHYQTDIGSEGQSDGQDELDQINTDQFNGDLYYLGDREQDCINLSRIRDHHQFTSTVSDFKDDYALGYAQTVHKSQGGQQDIVIILLPDEHKFMWTKSGRNLLYTAISRASKKCIIIGSRKLLMSSYNNVNHEVNCGLNF